MRFLLGLFTGMSLGLIFAPARGEETRAELARRVSELSELPAQKAAEVAQAGKQKAGDIGAEVGRRAAEAAVEAASDGLLGDKKQPA